MGRGKKEMKKYYMGWRRGRERKTDLFRALLSTSVEYIQRVLFRDFVDVFRRFRVYAFVSCAMP